MTYEVTDAMFNPKETLVKIHSGCYTECCTASDRYEATLPPSEVDAALFLAAIQFIDMLYFENPWGCGA